MKIIDLETICNSIDYVIDLETICNSIDYVIDLETICNSIDYEQINGILIAINHFFQ